MSDFDERITIGTIDDYELVGSAAPSDAMQKLGELEDLIENGELMNPAVKPDDTVYFIYKDAVVLEGTVDNVLTQYDPEQEKYFYHVILRNAFYNLFVQMPAAQFGKTWFKTKTQADAALQNLQEEA